MAGMIAKTTINTALTSMNSEVQNQFVPTKSTSLKKNQTINKGIIIGIYYTSYHSSSSNPRDDPPIYLAQKPYPR
jgi:hypothetical protein